MPVILRDDDEHADFEDEPVKKSNARAQLILATVVLVIIVVALMYWLKNENQGPALADTGKPGALTEEVVREPERMAVSVEQSTGEQSDAGAEEDAALSQKLFGGPVSEVAEISSPRLGGVSKITNISWAEGTLVETVTVRGNGGFSAAQIRLTTLADPPRCLVRIAGIKEPFYRDRIPMTLQKASAVRLGHHHDLEPPELHLVFDLTGRSVTASGPVVDGDSFSINLK